MKQKFIGEVEGIYNIITIIELVMSVLSIFAGLILYTKKSMEMGLFSIILGSVFLIIGLTSVYTFIKRENIRMLNYNIFYGLTMVVLGILAFLFNNVLEIIAGIFFVILAIQKITYSLFLKKYNEMSWLLTGVVGLFYLIIGIILFFSRGIIVAAGLAFLGYGIINAVSVIFLRKRSNNYIA